MFLGFVDDNFTICEITLNGNLVSLGYDIVTLGNVKIRLLHIAPMPMDYIATCIDIRMYSNRPGVWLRNVYSKIPAYRTDMTKIIDYKNLIYVNQMIAQS